MEKTIINFDTPTQVKFVDFGIAPEDNGGEILWLGGIAYRDEIICGCCGGIISLEDLYADHEDLKDVFPGHESPIVNYDNWVDINNEIKG